MPYYVYMTSNKAGTVLYTGITGDLMFRAQQHRNKVHTKSFTARFNATRLVFFEEYEDSLTAIAREKQIKGGSRADTLALINTMNPQWRDLYDDLTADD